MKPQTSGLLVVDKPSGCTSRDVVDRVHRWWPRRTRIGHTGTLDPLATGVLVLCIGQATRLTEYVQRMEKVYQTGLLLGARSDTDDADGHVVPVRVTVPPDRAAVTLALQGFIGQIDQAPPAYSAARVAGRRAYDLARRGEQISLKPRRVMISAIDLLQYDYPRLQLEVRCGSGTYIRSLARDLGDRLGCGALLETLRRTRVGPFTVAAALPLDADPARARASLLPLSVAVAELPRCVLGSAELARLRQGQAVPLPDVSSGVREVAVFDAAGELIAVAGVDPELHLLRPLKVVTGEQ